jgi:hypothetical protein
MSLASSKNLNILCDENTFMSSLNMGIRFKTDLEREHVKGKTEKIAIFMPYKESSPVQRDSKIEVFTQISPNDVVGREDTIKKIEKSINLFLKEKVSESQVVLLQAEAGMGITTLFRFTIQYIEQLNSKSKVLNIFNVNSDEYERYTPL